MERKLYTQLRAQPIGGATVEGIVRRAVDANEAVRRMSGLACSPEGGCGMTAIVDQTREPGAVLVKPICMRNRPSCAETCSAYLMFMNSEYHGSLKRLEPIEITRDEA